MQGKVRLSVCADVCAGVRVYYVFACVCVCVAASLKQPRKSGRPKLDAM